MAAGQWHEPYAHAEWPPSAGIATGRASRTRWRPVPGSLRSRQTLRATHRRSAGLAARLVEPDA